MKLVLNLNNGKNIEVDENLLKNDSSLTEVVQRYQHFKDISRTVVDPGTEQKVNLGDLKSIEIVFD